MKSLILILIVLIFATSIIHAQAQWQWVTTGADQGYGSVSDLVVDDSNNIYVTGYYSGTFIIANDTLSGYGNNDYDIFVAKYNALGTLQWIKTAGGPLDDLVGSITLDKEGNIYIAGSFMDTARFDNDTLISKGDADIFLSKYDNAGNLIWAKTWGGAYGDLASQVLVHNDGFIYLFGTIMGNSSYPPVVSNFATINFDSIMLTSYGNADVFIAKLDTSGKVIWAKNAGGQFGDYGGKFSIDSLCNIYITGFDGSTIMIFDNDTLLNKYTFVAKYDSSGHVVWTRGINKQNYAISGAAIGVDHQGNVYTSGSSYPETVSKIFGPGVVVNNDNAYLAKYDANGNILWAKGVGYQSNDDVGDLIIDSQNNVYLTGSFNYQGIFGNDTLASYGHDDIYVNKYDSNGNHIWTAQAGGATNDGGTALAFDHFGSLIVGGAISSAPAHFGSINVNAFSLWDMFVAKLSITTGIPIIASSPTDLQLYPNPSSGILHLQANKENFTSLKVFDQLGRVVAEQSLEQHQTAIDVHQLTDGIYYLQLKGKGLPETKKIIIQH